MYALLNSLIVTNSLLGLLARQRCRAFKRGVMCALYGF
uniref:Uncharacterized protein n=1 Tax=Anguilla anguilla TaxID=7936 RepID=A0A0E9S1J5_ANGAN